MSLVKISAIMTVKNGEKFLASSLTSVFSQTHLPQEIVVVNDGSDDNTWEMLQALRHEAPIPVQLFDTQGVGRSTALNLAVQHARYPWLANIDVDDLWLPQKLEQQAKVVRRFPNAEMVVTATHIVWGSVEDVQGECVSSDEFSVTPMGRKYFYVRTPINHSSVLFSRRFHDQLGGYDEMLGSQVDIDLWVRALRAGYLFYRVDLPLTVKRLHDEQSFEVGRRFEYTFNALKISLRKLWQLDAPFYYFPIPFAKLIYNNMPRKFRRGFIGRVDELRR